LPPSAADLNPRAPEIQQDGEERAGVERDVEGEAGVGPVGQAERGYQPGNEREMSGAGYGQKFREPLHNAEDNRF
jgi:hypothetical protein